MKPKSAAIESRVTTTEAGDTILVHRVLLEAGVDAVWNAYTTSAGYTAWAAPVAEVDLRIGGEIRAHYTPGTKLGAAGTNRLTVVNYVPQRLLTLRAQPTAQWPAALRKDAGRLSNVVLFEALEEKRTRVTSYGMGYRNTPEHSRLLAFFKTANAALYKHLVAYVEQGKRRAWTP